MSIAGNITEDLEDILIKIEVEFYKRSKFGALQAMSSNSKFNFALSDDEWQIVLDSLSNTVFNEDISEESRKKAKDLFLKLQKALPKT